MSYKSEETGYNNTFIFICIYSGTGKASSEVENEESRFDFRWRQEIFLIFISPRSAMRSTQPNIQWVTAALSSRLKRLGA